MIWQDLVFMVGGFVFAPALVFLLKGREKPPIKTSLPTAIVLSSYLVCYATMHFWLAAISTILTAICWYVLAYQRLRRKKWKS